MTLKNQTALVTGGLRGIGKAISEKFADLGADVAAVSRNPGDCQSWLDSLESLGVRAMTAKCDVSDRKQVSGMVDEVLNRFGKIDILVNNAGIFPACPLLELTEEGLNRVLDVNLKGTLFVTQEVARKSMVPRKSGTILCISSVDAWAPSVGVAAYAASKAGINSMVRSFALELAEHHITANGVAPGWVATKTVLCGDRWKKAVGDIPSGRLATPEEIARTVAFLCTEAGGSINGEMIHVNGGLLMR